MAEHPHSISIRPGQNIYTDSYTVTSDLFTISFQAHTCLICGAMLRETATILHQQWHESKGEI